VGLVTEKRSPFPLLALAAAAKASSAALAVSLESSFHKNKVGVDLWNTSSMALSLKGKTLGTELALTKETKLSAEIAPS